MYTIILDMDEEGLLQLTVVDKKSNDEAVFNDKAYSVVIQKAYSYLLKELKAQEKGEF